MVHRIILQLNEKIFKIRIVCKIQYHKNPVLFNSFSTIVILVFGFVMGFRAGAGIAGWLLAAVILLLFTLAMTWTAVMFGLLASNAEGVGVFSYILLFLLFISSAFAPTQTMPPAVRIFAENQPMTPIIEAVRSLLLGGSAGNNAITAILWCLGILIVTYIASVGIYKRKAA